MMKCQLVHEGEPKGKDKQRNNDTKNIEMREN